METDWSVTSLDGRADVTLVTVEVRNPSSVPRRVRVTNRLDGRVLPPRRDGVPESGWDEEGFESVVSSDGRRVLGYACSAPARRPPVSVADEGRAADAEESTTAATVLRELGDARPPADALPSATNATERSADEATERPADEAAERSADEVTTSGDATAEGIPDAVEAWLDTVAERVERGERVTDASVETATTVLESDEADIAALEERIASDAQALATVERRVAALAERAEAVDVPVEALWRLS
ncbi:hypothetical protein SAMN04488065_2262 [Haloplanus vescus]|uniref:DUF8080 domain-containing protein n=1 Tax=Haloplanus vescus TaxID=555874 RepID=A0A1H3ZCA6_9EURY|nr:hypothetical protein [Haloplanus vescus]SEA20982.1 hypothetical protein SAMN04488065_2262 [Haloplanus vescus]